jgi:hypothetical protein
MKDRGHVSSCRGRKPRIYYSAIQVPLERVPCPDVLTQAAVNAFVDVRFFA